MSWQPPPRPEWVRAVNDGAILPIAEVAERPFARDDLLAEARATLGLADGGMADFGRDDFLEPLDVLLPALEQEAELTVIGRWMTRRFLLRFLEVRLQLTAYVRADPGVVDEEINEPLFVTGAPRTGTTILHGLLAQDPASRVPEGWELLRPVPPPDPDPAEYAADARIPLADRELRLPGQVAGELDAIHVYRGRMHKECLSAMSFAFRSEEFTARYHVPSYVEWYERCDLRPAYDAHKLVLQILQRRSRNVRWVLKSPVHLGALPTLFAVYPDARLAVTHRDPLTVLASLTSLVATLRWAHSDRVDFAEIGRYHERLWTTVLDDLVTAGTDGSLDPARVHHVHYADFMQDQIGAVGALYNALGRALEPSTAQAMRDYLTGRPKDKHGAHQYSFADLGLDPTVERERFARYQRHFSVPDEAVFGVTDVLGTWQEFLARLDTLGRAVTTEPFPTTAADHVEGLRHLALQTVCWLEWSVGHQDPRAPMFQRQNDLVLQWGGPNADNIYRHARVHPSLRYRIVGKMHSCQDFILAIRRNFMHMEGSGTIVELSAHDIGIGPGDDFEILLGGDGDEPNRVPLPDGALSVSIREYYFDWQAREPATFTIECLDADTPPGPFTDDALAFGLDEAATHLHRSLTYWNRYMIDARAEQVDNEFGGGYDVARGLKAANYAFCFFDLAPDEALIVDCDIPQSRYWSFHLYSLAWWEALEYGSRVTTRNQTQTHVSGDGRVRVVVAHEDPGVPNWLDTEGRRDALLTLRWFWATGDPPQPSTRVVKLADVCAALPADTPVVSTDERRAELAARRAHLAWRFRT